MFKRLSISVVFGLALFFAAASTKAQSGNSGSIEGVVKDASGGVVAGATVEISYAVSGLHREITTESDGSFKFTNVPFNTYHLVVSAGGFASHTQDVEVRSGVPVTMQIALKVGTAVQTVTVEARDLVENESTFHTDIDRGLFDRLPLESSSSSVSSLVTLAAPGAVADSNGLVHAIGDHAESSFSVDGQPITDQTSKVFSNQIPVDSIQSLEVISGAPPAEFGDKTSLVIKVTTRSGLGQTKPVGSVKASYGSFGSANGGFDVAFGGPKWGNFIAANALNAGRFLDPPEFQVMHAKGNEQNLFDRVDLQLTDADSVHLNAAYTRSWFQNPNSFDAALTGQDQRAQIKTYNIAPTWTHLFSTSTLLNVAFFARHDQFNYYPSANPMADLSETATQQRKLTNLGLRSDLSHVQGMHNVKIGVTFEHTLLTEGFSLGLTDPTINSPCLVANAAGDLLGSGDTSLTDPAQCGGAGLQPNDGTVANAVAAPFIPILGCIDLTRPTPAATDGCATPQSALFGFHGRGDVREIALYLQDTITKGNWSFNVGVRGDLYRGLTKESQIEPRAGISYNIKRSNTVMRVSYARILETPFNENLVVASVTGDPFLDAIFGGSSGPIRAGQRNEFHAGLQQAFGRYLVVDGDYLWKYTHNAYDFSDLLNTPIFFPIGWHNSKISGFNARVSVPNFHGVTVLTVMGHASARYFQPQVGGLGTSDGPVFRIDHDQSFQQTTHVQYQPRKRAPWVAFNWRYDSGLVAGAVPFAGDSTTPVDLTGLSADQQIQAGLFCGSVFPTLSTPLVTCDPSLYGSTRLKIPAPGTENDDHNPPRVAPRHLFDASVGDDDLFHGDHYKWSLRLTVINLTNKTALYNFLSTFSGTHFVTPRSYTAELGFHF
ncbi:MAG: collagen-binding protein [Acidobacteria bacterium 13_1_20CM_58_21]|nr:MAG: collagen-binding protein [Acidobacteria bacterium 13_1_20CM_58_21]